MNKLIKIVQSPHNPPVEYIAGIVIQLFVPYSEKIVTIQVNPNIQEYQENADTKDAKVRQVMLFKPTEQTKTFSFDIRTNRKHSYKTEKSEYEIELMNIGKEKIEGQDFLYYEFNVSWD